MIFHKNSLHYKGPILEAKLFAERMVVLRSSAPPRVCNPNLTLNLTPNPATPTPNVNFTLRAAVPSGLWN